MRAYFQFRRTQKAFEATSEQIPIPIAGWWFRSVSTPDQSSWPQHQLWVAHDKTTMQDGRWFVITADGQFADEVIPGPPPPL